MLKNDPIKQFGIRAADHILSVVQEAPVPQRTKTLEAILRQVDPSGKFWEQIKDLSTKLATKIGSDGLQVALAAGLSDLYLKGVYQAGRGDLRALSGFALGCDDCGNCGGNCAGNTDLSGLALTFGSGGPAIKNISSPLGKVISAPLNLVNDALAGLSKLACNVSKNPLAQVAASAGGFAIGGPGGAAAAQQGTQVAQSMCEPPPVPQSSLPSWVIPAAIGGGVLLIGLVLLK